MIWNRLEQSRIKKRYRDSLAEAIGRLEEKDISCLHTVYCVLAADDRELTRRGGRAMRKALETFTTEQMIRLSERFRQYTSLEWSIDWRNLDIRSRKGWFESEQDYVCVLILGSFHPNGYYRETCLGEMSGYPGTLPYLILRLNDWVESVRLSAAGMVQKRLSACPLEELFVSMMALDKVKRSQRRDDKELIHIEKAMEDRLEREANRISVELVLKEEYAVRRSIYRFLFEAKRLEQRTAQELLDRERHSFCQTMIFTGLLAHYDCSMDMAEGYMKHPSSCVRRKAMDYKYGILKEAWPGLETMLLDTNHGIRDMAAYILKRRGGFDVLAYYMEHLSDPSPVTAIKGIGEQGGSMGNIAGVGCGRDTRKLAALILPYLESPHEKVVKSAIEAIGRLEGEEGQELYWKYLLDRRVSVSKAAYLCIRRNGIHPGAGLLYEELLRWAQEEPDRPDRPEQGPEKGQDRPMGLCHVRRYLILLMVRENSWQRLPYLIYMFCDPSLDRMKDKILGAMGNRSLYASIGRSQAMLIEKALAQAGDRLPEKLVKDIRFDMKFVLREF